MRKKLMSDDGWMTACRVAFRLEILSHECTHVCYMRVYIRSINGGQKKCIWITISQLQMLMCLMKMLLNFAITMHHRIV